MLNSLSRFSLVFSLGVPLLVAAPQVSYASDQEFEEPKQALNVIVDRAKVLRMDKDADTVIVGNPSIVDATVQDSRTIVLTGRSYGVTNLIVLDSAGDPVVDETVVVQNHETNTVRIYRRAIRETLACSPVCESTLTIGDDNAVFSANMAQIQGRVQLSTPAN